MSEENDFALEGDLIDKVAAVLALEVDKVVLFLKVSNEVFKVLRSEVSSPNADIDALFSSIFLLILSFLGAVSASTKLSTICVRFKPDPF